MTEQIAKERATVQAMVPDMVAKLGASSGIIPQMIPDGLGKLLGPVAAGSAIQWPRHESPQNTLEARVLRLDVSPGPDVSWIQ